MQLAENNNFHQIIWEISSWYINLFGRFLTEEELYYFPVWFLYNQRLKGGGGGP